MSSHQEDNEMTSPHQEDSEMAEHQQNNAFNEDASTTTNEIPSNVATQHNISGTGGAGVSGSGHAPAPDGAPTSEDLAPSGDVSGSGETPAPGASTPRSEHRGYDYRGYPQPGDNDHVPMYPGINHDPHENLAEAFKDNFNDMMTLFDEGKTEEAEEIAQELILWGNLPTLIRTYAHIVSFFLSSNPAPFTTRLCPHTDLLRFRATETDTARCSHTGPWITFTTHARLSKRPSGLSISMATWKSATSYSPRPMRHSKQSERLAVTPSRAILERD
jgi:hypothetical protein